MIETEKKLWISWLFSKILNLHLALKVLVSRLWICVGATNPKL